MENDDIKEIKKIVKANSVMVGINAEKIEKCVGMVGINAEKIEKCVGMIGINAEKIEKSVGMIGANAEKIEKSVGMIGVNAKKIGSCIEMIVVNAEKIDENTRMTARNFLAIQEIHEKFATKKDFEEHTDRILGVLDGIVASQKRSELSRLATLSRHDRLEGRVEVLEEKVG
jgi:exonuclease I